MGTVVLTATIVHAGMNSFATLTSWRRVFATTREIVSPAIRVTTPSLGLQAFKFLWESQCLALPTPPTLAPTLALALRIPNFVITVGHLLAGALSGGGANLKKRNWKACLLWPSP